MPGTLRIVCPHCDTVNRVPPAKLAAGGRCGECYRPLFEGRPMALDRARFECHLDKSDIPLLVDFWAGCCGPCRAMTPEFERAARTLEPQLRLVKVDIDAAPELAQHFAVRSVPTLLFVRHGSVLDRTAGAMSAAALERWALSHANG